jgi:hypothetical protein
MATGQIIPGPTHDRDFITCTGGKSLGNVSVSWDHDGNPYYGIGGQTVSPSLSISCVGGWILGDNKYSADFVKNWGGPTYHIVGGMSVSASDGRKTILVGLSTASYDVSSGIGASASGLTGLV